MISDNLLENVKYSEGFSETPYEDDKGILTIGFGTNISVISKKEAELLLSNRINNAVKDVDKLLGYDVIIDLSDKQKDSLYELMYWIGLPRFSKFVKMIKALRSHNWNKASEEMMDSQLGVNYKTRANRLSSALKG